MSRKQLMAEMDAKEVFNWMAYELSVSPEHREGWQKEIELERQQSLTDEERGDLMKQMFRDIAGPK